MPQERGSKASKWEILTKAINEHQKQADNLKQWQTNYTHAVGDNEMLRREVAGLRMEIAQLRGELGSSSGHAPPPPPPPASQPPGPYAADPYANPARPELPPIRSISNNMPNGPDSMMGVQYDAPRVNGYR